MSNTITIELCAEDRARLDKIIAALERDTKCEGCVKSALEFAADVKTAANTPAESAQEPTGAEKAETLTDTHPIPDGLQWTTSDVKETPQEEPAPTVTFEQLRAKVMELTTGFGGKKKAQVREIINTYAKKVSDVPEDKYVEVMGKLLTLEREA